MIIGIEGTGSQTWGQLDLRRTFVRRILLQSTLSPKYYFIGPSNSGLDGWQIINGAWLKVMNSHEGPLVLVGYSRGAAYCMDVARTLGKRGGRCDLLVLFDAVARQPDQDLPEKVPANVTTCYHAYRDPRAGSRKFFSNVGKAVENTQTKFEKRMFYGSHGALGGTWYDAREDEGDGGDVWGEKLVGSDDRNLVNVASLPITGMIEDHAASNKAAEWMWPRLIAAGVLPRGANPYSTAPPFTGSMQPGVANQVN